MSEADVPIYVSIELRQSRLRDQVRTEMEGVREEIESGLGGIRMPVGDRIRASVTDAAPSIRDAVAAAVAAGGEDGAAAVAASLGTALAAMGGRAAFHETDLGPTGIPSGGYWQGGGPRQLPGRSIAGGAASQWQAQEDQFEGEEIPPPLMIEGPQEGPEYGPENGRRSGTLGQPINEAEAARNAEEAGDNESGGAGIVGGLIASYFAIRLVRGMAEYVNKEADIDAEQFQAQNMPGRTAEQRVKRSDLAVRAAQQDIDENSGIIGGARELWSKNPANITGGDFQQNLQDKLAQAQIEQTNAQKDASQQKFSEERQRLEATAGVAGLHGSDRERAEAQNQYAEGLKKLNEEYQQLGGKTTDLVAGEKALADARDKSIAAINVAEAIATQEEQVKGASATDRLNNDPQKAERDELESSIKTGREKLISSGASQGRIDAFENDSDLRRLELKRKQDQETEGKDFGADIYIAQQNTRAREAQMRSQGDEHGASMLAEKEAGDERVASLREQADVTNDAVQKTRLLAEADALQAANAAEAAQKQKQYADAMALEHQATSDRTDEAKARSEGRTGAASDAEFADKQKEAMAKLMAGPHTGQQVEDLKNEQYYAQMERKHEQEQHNKDIQLETMRANADSTGNPALQKRAEYEALREGIIKDETAAKGTASEGYQRQLDEAKIRDFVHHGAHLEEGFTSTDSLWHNMNAQLAKGGSDPLTSRMAKGDLSSLLGGGGLTSDLGQAGKDISKAADSINKAFAGKDLVVIKR